VAQSAAAIVSCRPAPVIAGCKSVVLGFSVSFAITNLSNAGALAPLKCGSTDQAAES
jgi:hypothetical protein